MDQMLSDGLLAHVRPFIAEGESGPTCYPSFRATVNGIDGLLSWRPGQRTESKEIRLIGMQEGDGTDWGQVSMIWRL